jgi:hypothetical protein
VTLKPIRGYEKLNARTSTKHLIPNALLPELTKNNIDDHYTKPINKKIISDTHDNIELYKRAKILDKEENAVTSIKHASQYKDSPNDKVNRNELHTEDNAKSEEIVTLKSRVYLKAKNNKSTTQNTKELLSEGKAKKSNILQHNKDVKQFSKVNEKKIEVDVSSIESKSEFDNSSISNENSKVKNINKKTKVSVSRSNSIKVNTVKDNNIKRSTKNNIKTFTEEKMKHEEEKEDIRERNHKRIIKKSQSNHQTIEHKELYIEHKTIERSDSPAKSKGYEYWKNTVRKWYVPNIDERKMIELEILKMKLQREPKRKFNLVKLSKLI